MFLSSLNTEERDVVRRAMAATFEFFDRDFQTRLAVSPETMRRLLSEWPSVHDEYISTTSNLAEDHVPDAYLAINNAMNDLLHGVGITDAKAKELTGVDRAEMHRIYVKWAGERGTGLL